MTDTTRELLRIYCPSVKVYPGHKDEKDVLTLIERSVEEKDLDNLTTTIKTKYPKVFKGHEKIILALISVLKSQPNLRVRSKVCDHGFLNYDCDLFVSF